MSRGRTSSCTVNKLETAELESETFMYLLQICGPMGFRVNTELS